MTYPAVIFLILTLWAFTWPMERVLYLMFGSLAFGSLAILPPEAVAGVNLLPATAASLVFIIKQVFDTRTLGSVIKSAFALQGTGLLTIFWVIGILSSYFYPRVFAYSVEVMPMRGLIAPVMPTMANITQPAYLTVAYLVVLIMAYWSRQPKFVATFINALLLSGSLLALTGIVDFVLGSAQTALFAPFKTAQYAYMDGSQVLGLRRVEGLMTEASAYGAVTVITSSFLLLVSPTLQPAWKRLAAQGIGWVLVMTALLSTSSTAYLGLAIFFMCYGGNLILRIADRENRKDKLLAPEIGLCILGFVALSVVVMFNPALFDLPGQFLDQILFKKASSDSYIDRMNWNRLAMEALWSTKGIGVGVGSARASNWAVSVLSNTGIAGGFCMFGFFILQLIKRSMPGTRGVVRATKMTLLVFLIMYGASATSPDFGTTAGGLFGVLIANTYALGRKRPMRPWRERPGLRRYASAPTPASIATRRLAPLPSERGTSEA